MIKLDINYCHACRSTHEFGKHTPRSPSPGEAASKLIAAVLSQPAAAIEHPPKWDKNKYQAQYMADRREANRNGFSHLTVAEYRKHRETKQGAA